jgi:protein transport protein SEC61 subunit gamma-like protein
MDVAEYAVKPVKEFAKDSYRLVKRCTKPDRKGARPASCAQAATCRE